MTKESISFFFQNTIKMGKQFGNLAKITGITYFRLSPHEQKAFSGMIKEGLPNFFRRAQETLLRAGPCKYRFIIVNNTALLLVKTL